MGCTKCCAIENGATVSEARSRRWTDGGPARSGPMAPCYGKWEPHRSASLSILDEMSGSGGWVKEKSYENPSRLDGVRLEKRAGWWRMSTCSHSCSLPLLVSYFG